ncbi:hypothetical protein [Streptomyces rubiginosohelvolus]|uniref:Uncharacterized protein n=1 Tax=Streptomyces rubiginosohelvolus TaxID=67362 RepID=A0ABW6FD00_9ACTN
MRRPAASLNWPYCDQNNGYRRDRVPSTARTSAMSQSADHPHTISPYSSSTLSRSC